MPTNQYSRVAAATDDVVSIDDLSSQIVGLAGRLAAATCRWLLLVAQFDVRDGATEFGLGSTAAWLSYACGLSRRTAVEHVRVARALTGFPALVEAMSAGRLSYSHIRAISRLAKPGEEELVGDLIEVAEHGTVGQLETMVRGLRTVEENAAASPPVQEEYLSYSWTSESRWRCSARRDPERGALIQRTIETIARTEGMSQADALVRMAEIAHAALNDTATRTELRGDEQAAVVIHLDAAKVFGEPLADELPRSRERGGPARSAERTDRPYARLAEGPGLPDRVVKRLLCSGRIRTVVHDGGNSHRPVCAYRHRPAAGNRTLQHRRQRRHNPMGRSTPRPPLRHIRTRPTPRASEHVLRNHPGGA